MKKSILLFLIIGSCFSLFSQKHDNVWLMGYFGGSQSPQDTFLGISIFDFESLCDPQITNNQEIELNFEDTHVSISDEAGNLLFYSNGIFINDASHQLMQNGDNINAWEIGGQDVPQGALVIPFPNNPDQYFLFHEVDSYVDGWGLAIVALEYSLIDMTLNNGLGAVTLKKEQLISDTLDYGKLTATKHANGRDWWILVQELNTNKYYRILLSPEGIEVVDKQSLGTKVETGFGAGVFSPRGDFFAKVDLVGGVFADDFLNIYEFDRCTGLMSNPINNINLGSGAFTGGIAISPNSRFLYVSSYDYIYQFDLWAPDIEDSKVTVAEYDGFEEPFPTRFYQMQLAPNGKIYVSIPSSVWYLHEIHHPNEKGLACNVTQHSLRLPTLNGFSIPNFPNYHLGPIDNSPCDTLGINNIPLAGFRFDRDSSNSFLGHFISLSYYEPEEWFWTFEDNQTSTLVNPSHTYDESGVYEVCLTVSNEYGSDTACKMVEVGVTNTIEVTGLLPINIYPNPASDFFWLELPTEQSYKKGEIQLHNTLGQHVQSYPLNQSLPRQKCSINGLEAGLYFYEVRLDGYLRANGKIFAQ